LLRLCPVLALTLVACPEKEGTDSASSDPMTISQVNTLLQTSCAATCHRGDEPAADLDLTPDMACADLIGVPSTLDPSWLRVVPGHSEESLLICKVDPDCVLPEGAIKMPLGDVPLSPNTVTALAGWVDAGAPGCADADITPPAFEGALAAEGLASAIRLSWSAATDDVTPAADIEYLIYEASTPGGQDFDFPILLTAPGATEATIAPLPNDTTLYYVVRARDVIGNIDENEVEVSATTAADGDTTPPVFAGVTGAIAIGTTAVQLTWDAATDDVSPSGSISYVAYVATTSGDQEFTTPAATSAPGASELLVPDLTASTTYYFVVHAVDALGNEDANTAEVSAATGGAVSFSADVEPIFADNCTGAGCHSNPKPQEDLDLRAGQGWDLLVDVPANQCASRLRVAPGDPDNSYLIDKIKGINLCFGSQMPKVGSLTDAEIQIVADWVSDGAAND
jgi:hypothetical protein